VVFAVLNDRRLGMVELGLSALYGRSAEFSTGEIDIAAMARSMGARAVVVQRADELAGIACELADRDGPLVLDLRIDRSIKMPKNGRFEALGNTTQRRVMN
jgi:thiamine pyrophosphate-dependent acetolactate synthase large subunit-like protein